MTEPDTPQTDEMPPPRSITRWSAVRDRTAIIFWTRRTQGSVLVARRVAWGNWQWRWLDQKGTVIDQAQGFATAQKACDAANAAVGDPAISLLPPSRGGESEGTGVGSGAQCVRGLTWDCLSSC